MKTKKNRIVNNDHPKTTIGKTVLLDVIFKGLKHTGCPKKNETQVLFYISATKYQIFKIIFSPENGDTYANFEHKSISVQLLGTEIIAKQNGILD